MKTKKAYRDNDKLIFPKRTSENIYFSTVGLWNNIYRQNNNLKAVAN